MHLTTALVLSLGGATLAQNRLEERQDPSSVAAASKFSSAASHLLSLYIPTSVLPALASAASSHSLTFPTSEIYSLLNSAFTATTTPDWFTAIPTQYSSNIHSLESRIEELRGAAFGGTIEGAPRIYTSTDSEGRSVSSTSMPGAEGTGKSTAGGSSTSVAGRTGAGASSSSSSGYARPTGVPGGVVGVLGFLGAVVAL
ncbi:hypothetical protein EJ08DRAFT_734057 [Tothia fuscella]|uniref:Uncharacterized protein n=1 Tax=Tothia fuscella TaxID=1048955 RepID=A0A9P4NRW5_9PEZI|nr:hypothetical protein EJ08DRAFT_734057 [Tothia fuscella]